MAKVKFAAPVSGLRGSVGGVVFSANHATSFVKSRTMPSSKRSKSLADTHVAFAALPELWRLLTSSQRDDWATWAADPAQEKTNSLGEAYYCTGYQWFMALNNRLLGFTESPIEDPPPDPKPTPIVLYIPTIYDSNVGGSELAINTVDFTDYRLTMSLAVYNTPTVICSLSDMKICVRKDYPVSSPIDIQADIESIWGTLTHPQSWIMLVQRSDDYGQISTPLQTNGIILD
jgi:hypothetical protein